MLHDRTIRPASDERPRGSARAIAVLVLGIGCLVVLIFFAAVAFFSYARG